jgi:signal transduction histidine kinase
LNDAAIGRLELTAKSTLLVVDDTPDNLTLMSNLLRDDYKVKLANSGEKALKIAMSDSPPDLILLDILMPGMSGYEVCQRLKSDPKSMDIPVIFITGKSDAADEKKGLELGASDYITKPISPAIVLARVKIHLSLKAVSNFLRDKNEYLELEVAKRTRELMALKEIAVRNLQLEEASKMKSQFLASMSHELRTPLNSILGFSEVLRDGLAGELSEQQNEYVNDIFSSGSHLLALINDILDLSKVEAGKMVLDLEPVQAMSLLQAGLQVVREKAHVHRLRMVTEVEDELADIWLDARKVKQILYNLISNAVKFTPDGGEIHVAARRVGAAAAAAARGMFSEYLELTVTDTGIGISSADQARLFEPFIQIDSAMARRYQGTGLGLAMVKRLAELHGGTVGLQSVPEQGSTFTVWLPWRTQAEPVPSAKGSELGAEATNHSSPHAPPMAIARGVQFGA